MIPLNDGIDQLRVLIEDQGFEHSGILVEGEHPPDAITVSMSDTTEWTITAHRQRSRERAATAIGLLLGRISAIVYSSSEDGMGAGYRICRALYNTACGRCQIIR